MKKYMFALMSFVALAAYAVTPATQWGDVSPTNTLAKVAYDAGLMSTNTSSGVYIGGGLRVANHPTIVHSLSDDAAWADRLGYGSISFGGGSFASGQFSYALGFYCQALGDRSFAHGYESKAYGSTDYAGGTGCIASNGNTIAIGMYSCSTNYSFVWQGYPVLYPQLYYSHGRGSFNINPVGGLAGFWIGETNMATHIEAALATAITNNLGLSNNCVKIGIGADTVDAANAVAVGLNTYAQYNAVAVGSTAKSVAGEGVAVGPDTTASEWGAVAIGKGATASSAYAVQIGQGTNNSNNTFKVFNTMLLDADGRVPLLAGSGAYDLSTDAGITNALADVIRALGGSVQ